MKSLSWLLGILWVLGTSMPAAADEEIVAHLHGRAPGAFGFNLKLNVMKVQGEVVHGQYRADSNGFEGDIVELVPPSSEKPYWCARGNVLNDAFGLGVEVIWFVKDFDEGDQLSYRFDLDPDVVATCDSSTPEEDFRTVTNGKFDGKVKP